MPRVDIEYRRKHGNKDVVTVVGIQNGIVQLVDCDGRHFVNKDTFHQYFKEEVKQVKTFYGYPGQERLSSDPEDVVINLMEDVGENEYLSFPIKVFVWEQMTPFKDLEKFSNNILEDILETLDENYGDPDSAGTEPTDSMKKALLEFTKVLAKEYHVLGCDPTGEILEFSKEEAEKIVGIR